MNAFIITTELLDARYVYYVRANNQKAAISKLFESKFTAPGERLVDIEDTSKLEDINFIISMGRYA